MARRRLSPDEQALWQRLVQSVSPLSLRSPAPEAPLAPVAAPLTSDPAPTLPPARKVKGRVPPARVPPPPRPAPQPVDAVLDRSWEKRIRSGALQPDASVDLHGHSVADAHRVLEAALARSVAAGHRILLVIAGKPRPERSPRPSTERGAIRAEISDWLDRSPHADRIASVRSAHQRHGGSGALYIILRRTR